MKLLNSRIVLCIVQMLVIFRNPKDTLVSFYHFSNNNPVLPSGQSWESFYSHFLSGDGERASQRKSFSGFNG